VMNEAALLRCMSPKVAPKPTMTTSLSQVRFRR
jgi:hypothetical protein